MAEIPMADSVPRGVTGDFAKIATARRLAGAANTTKWNELISSFRGSSAWRPKFRSKSIAGGITKWDGEWFYHLPFPFICVEWFDIEFQEVVRRGSLVEPEVIDHSEVFTEMLSRIGLDVEKGRSSIRIWGYLPRSYDEFDSAAVDGRE